ncbi:hypothetical protein KDH_11920 [Dictyobacter sp. S3.2.2.5]|uniref:NERD domain-containing protein n=1 Tax=Dictyobacter halimunensis TaxID=3026934 RepID=A0ABQ6FP94_9CHLR|nr:hypothetical protein KDH_11920 [Dictyobacter sp. S3.2.2.5]
MAELISAGPSSFATEGERQAAAILQQYLPADWIVICNKILPTNDGRSFEIDFIVIGKNWVFLLDEMALATEDTATLVILLYIALVEEVVWVSYL